MPIQLLLNLTKNQNPWPDSQGKNKYHINVKNNVSNHYSLCSLGILISSIRFSALNRSLSYTVGQTQFRIFTSANAIAGK